ncbi:SAM-dependent methyltransferase [Micromonospora azadirachtae]|uniref:SAM-dependent methyltransferase n=1 Tax=Micromonospora azadirachtae TaxID=1970735 RepID=A0ABW3A9S8_9ACTN
MKGRWAGQCRAGRTTARARPGTPTSHDGGVPYILRSPQDLATCFAGLTMVEPGPVPIPLWRPDDADAEGVDAYGAVARKR